MRAEIEIIKHGMSRGYGFTLKAPYTTHKGIELEKGECVVWSKKHSLPQDGEIWEGDIESFPQSRYYKSRINVFFPKRKVGDNTNPKLEKVLSEICCTSIRVQVIAGNIMMKWGRGFKDGIQQAKFGAPKKGTPTEVGASVGSSAMLTDFNKNLSEKFGEEITQKIIDLFGLTISKQGGRYVLSQDGRKLKHNSDVRISDILKKFE